MEEQCRYNIKARRKQQSALWVLLMILALSIFWQVLQQGHYISSPMKTRQVNLQELTSKVNPNTATAASLARLPGIGPAKAQDIVEYRKLHTANKVNRDTRVFKCADDLEQIKGIGKATVERIREYLDFDGP